MKEAFPVTVEVEDNFTQDLFVVAVPQMGATLNIRRGTFKVKEIEFRGSGDTAAEPLKIVLRCVPILAF